MFIIVPRLRLRSLVVLFGVVVGAMMLLHPNAEAAPDDPTGGALPPATAETGTAVDPYVPPYTPITGQGEAALWESLGVRLGSPAPPTWAGGPDGPGPYFSDTAPSGGNARYLPDGTILVIATGTTDAFSVFHQPADDTQFPMSTVSINADGVVTDIDLTAAGVVAPTPAKPLLSINPTMWLAAQFGEGAQSMLKWTMDDATAATTPDLSAGWFLDAWAKSYGAGTVVLLFLLALHIIAGVRNGSTGPDWVEDTGTAVAGFFVAGAVGPVVGQLIIRAGAGVAGNISVGIVASLQTIVDILNRVSNSDGQMVGGSIVALLLMAAAFIASVAMLVVMLASTAIIFLSAAMFLIAFAWIILKGTRSGAKRVGRVFLVMVAAKPALFAVLSLAVGAIGASTAGTGSVPKDVVTLVVGIALMLIAGAAPFLVYHYLGSSEGGHGAPGGGLNMLILTRGARGLRGRR